MVKKKKKKKSNLTLGSAGYRRSGLTLRGAAKSRLTVTNRRRDISHVIFVKWLRPRQRYA